ncbi:lipase [Pseudoscardovia radai]|uniref:Lipase n=1 Tax=Pseudoscardovia radai TaxID=987066 RepID=A0A261EVY6_9BIFI|nr:GDSL-type esterase/lipase family protein [Pseudoscardovia radai]OZG51034.1 lipase [Pseudoscardovia radai]
MTHPTKTRTAGRGTAPRSNPFRRIVAGTQAQWAKTHVKLAHEPEGDRFGTVCAPEADPDATPITMLAVGDSMVAGCGTSHQSKGLIPQEAYFLSKETKHPVQWRTDAKLGATIRRVKYRQLAKLDGQDPSPLYDIITICAGSNDIMARRKPSDWGEDLADAIDIAKRHARAVDVMSCGQLYTIPSLGKALREELERQCDAQAEVSLDVCTRHGAHYINLVHEELGCDHSWFWCGDQFHPNAEGYERLARACVETMARERMDLILSDLLLDRPQSERVGKHVPATNGTEPDGAGRDGAATQD